MKAIHTIKTVVLLTSAFCTFSLNAQNVGIGTSNPKAALDISSTSSGLLVPRMNTATRNALSTGADQNGMQVYDTDTKSIWFYDHTATAWTEMTTAGTDKFVDGTDPLHAVYTTGNVGIGTADPEASLHVVGNIKSSDTVIAQELNVREPIVTGLPLATGGTVTTSGDYTIHTFATTGTFTFTPNGNTTVEYLVVAGGGAGGNTATSGGGGAGGVNAGTAHINNSLVTVVVGAGGIGNTGNAGNNGGNSSFGTITSLGGGGGGNYQNAGANGGSGGGGGSGQANGIGTTGQGNDGGTAVGSAAGVYGGGGGGGAGSAGILGTTNSSGSGGDGIQSDISGTLNWYGGGGGGGKWGAAPSAPGGNGGGGTEGISGVNPTAGAPNTGGGGGGNGASGGANGGSGIVIIRYLTNPGGPAIVTNGTNVGIGTDAPTAKLSVNGSANKTGGGTWAVFSDKRSKEHITNYEKGRDEIVKLHPVSFKYKEEFGWGTDTYVGLIAQEVEQIVPSMVTTKAVKHIPDFKEVDPNEITYMLINAVKTLHTENKALEPALSATSEKVAAYTQALESQRLELDHIESALKTHSAKEKTQKLNNNK